MQGKNRKPAVRNLWFHYFQVIDQVIPKPEQSFNRSTLVSLWLHCATSSYDKANLNEN